MRRTRSPFGRARSRALLAAAIAASLLLPATGGFPATASAAPSPADSLAARAADSPDGLIHLALSPGENVARYIMTVKTIGQAPKAAACTTNAVSGEIVLAPDGSVVTDQSKIVLDQRTLKCEAPLRDSMAQQLLQTAQHPMAEFQVKGAPGLSVPLPTGDATFQLSGDQSVKGVTQPTVYDTTANLTPDTMTGLAHANLKMTSFGITPPHIGPLIDVSDDMVAEVNLKATLGAPAGGGAAAPAAAPATDPATEPAAGDPGDSADSAP